MDLVRNGDKTRIDAKKSDAVCGRIGKNTSCYRPVKRLILISTVNNWKDYAKRDYAIEKKTIKDDQ